jgi:hypothetical protein
LVRLRQPRITRAPFAARARAVSKPIPLLAPVTTATRCERSGMSSSLQLIAASCTALVGHREALAVLRIALGDSLVRQAEIGGIVDVAPVHLLVALAHPDFHAPRVQRAHRHAEVRVERAHGRDRVGHQVGVLQVVTPGAPVLAPVELDPARHREVELVVPVAADRDRIVRAHVHAAAATC